MWKENNLYLIGTTQLRRVSQPVTGGKNTIENRTENFITISIAAFKMTKRKAYL